MSAAQQPPATAQVKRYNCLFSDQVNKKHRTYKDGYIRHHHFNNRLYLLSPSQAQLSSSFYQPVKPTPLPLADNFVLEDGTKLEFDGFVAEVGAIEFESTTNVSAIHARAKDPSQALNWGKAMDDHDASASPRASTSAPTPRRSTPASASRPTSRIIADLVPATARPATTTPSRQILVGPRPSYKGFGVPPPTSYTPGEKARKPRHRGSPPPAFPKALPDGGRPTTSTPGYKPMPNPKPFASGAHRGVCAGTPKGAAPSFSPYARPAPATPAGSAARGDRASAAGIGTPREELGMKELGGVSTPTRGAVAAFKPPRPGGGLGGGTPSSLGRR